MVAKGDCKMSDHEEQNKASRNKRAQSRRAQLRSQNRAINFWKAMYEDVSSTNIKLKEDREWYRAQLKRKRHWFWKFFS